MAILDALPDHSVTLVVRFQVAHQVQGAQLGPGGLGRGDIVEVQGQIT
jgi:hypothetical protein